MSLSNRAELKASILNWLDREDADDISDDLITLFEAEINSDLRVAGMVKRCTGTTTQDYTKLPPDFREAISVEITSASPTQDVTYMDPNGLIAWRKNQATGTPRHYTFVGDTIAWAPRLGGEEITFEIVYFQAVGLATGAGNATNWLLTKYPNVYLFGALKFADLFFKNDSRAAGWKGEYQDALGRMNDEYTRQKVSGSRLNRTTGVKFG